MTHPVNGPGRTERAAGMVYQQLRHELLTSEIPPGTRMREVHIAERLGVSRTPVREALRRLEGDGFVQRINGNKLVATAEGIDDIGDIGLLRVEIDGLAARLAVARATAQDWQRLAGLAEELESATSTEDLNRRHLDFHRAVYAAAFGQRMLGFVENQVLPYLESTRQRRARGAPEPTQRAESARAAALRALQRRRGACREIGAGACRT